MIALKIQCGCGQRYAFDVEPLGGRLPAPVACPTCGADGTYVANTMLVERLPAAAPVANAAPRYTLAAAAPAVASPASVAVAAPAAVRVGSTAPPATAPAHSAPPKQRL